MLFSDRMLVWNNCNYSLDRCFVDYRSVFLVLCKYWLVFEFV